MASDHVELPAVMGQIMLPPDEVVRKQVKVVGDDMISLSVGTEDRTAVQLMMDTEDTQELVEQLECALQEDESDA